MRKEGGLALLIGEEDRTLEKGKGGLVLVIGGGHIPVNGEGVHAPVLGTERGVPILVREEDVQGHVLMKGGLPRKENGRSVKVPALLLESEQPKDY